MFLDSPREREGVFLGILTDNLLENFKLRCSEIPQVPAGLPDEA